MKKKNDDQQLIRAILGKDKYFMFNVSLLKAIGLEGAALITYILDKIEYRINIEPDALDKGVIIYRNELEEIFGMSPYRQRRVERALEDKQILSVKEIRTELNTYNLYSVDLENLWSLIKGG